jgi:molybdenum cofactor cytidylyltransferase
MITGVLLAAGGARRFRSQKLIALFQGKPIVRHAANALASATDDLIVVVGHEGPAVAAALSGMNTRIVPNQEWELGMATSIQRGVQSVEATSDAIVIGVGDQPELDPAVVRMVIARWRETGQPIVSASYRGVRGHPVLFARSVFPELLALHGDAGARLLIERTPERVSYVQVDAPMPPDIDTSGELAALELKTGGPVDR